MRSGSLRLVVTCAAAISLVAPALPHGHAGHRPSTEVVARSCAAGGGATGHLHAATVEQAPPCPACAAGATWQASLAAAESTAPMPDTSAPRALACPSPSESDSAPQASRAPPALLDA